jgi:hypothetical protein
MNVPSMKPAVRQPNAKAITRQCSSHGMSNFRFTRERYKRTLLACRRRCDTESSRGGTVRHRGLLVRSRIQLSRVLLSGRLVNPVVSDDGQIGR